MTLAELEPLIGHAIENKEVLEVTYVRMADGATTCRYMEPFDISVGRRTKYKATPMFWGWCRFHDRIEQKLPANIVSVQGTGQHFDPKIREAIFTSPPQYRIPRNWG